MHLYELPLVFVLVGLALYTVLAGADFGAALWQFGAGRGPRAERVRDHAHHAMGPVWEANHVWLIFVLTVMWTAYPVALGSLASTLSVPLFIAGLGIVVRGAAYALRSGAHSERELRTIDAASAAGSVLAPFALATAVGGVASRRVPVGNAAGNLFSSWLNPTSVLVGVLAILTSAYLAAVFLSADAVRRGDEDLASAFRARALVAGLVAGVVTVAGPLVLHADAHPLYRGLTHGGGLAAGLLSGLAGVGTLALVWRRRFEPARYTAAFAVAAVIAGWALAQRPTLLPGLTIQAAAASHDTLVAVVVTVLAGGVILFPSLALLFRLALGGRLEEGEGEEGDVEEGEEAPSAIGGPVGGEKGNGSSTVGRSRPRVVGSGLAARAAGACAVAGIGFLTVAEAGWAHAIGVLALLAAVVLGFLAVTPGELEAGRGN